MNVTGNQSHSASQDQVPIPASTKASKNAPALPESEIEKLPRVFSHVFVLSGTPGDVYTFRIVSETFRFVG